MSHFPISRGHISHSRLVIPLAATLIAAFVPAFLTAQNCLVQDGHRVLHADVVALDQPFVLNRLGASMPGGMLYALRSDVVNTAGQSCAQQSTVCSPGQVHLRSDKRPRPLVLRMNVNDRLEVNFTNLLSPGAPSPGQTFTRMAGLAVPGLELTAGTDASWAGTNPNGFANPGESRTYHYAAQAEGTFLFYSVDETGQIGEGLFGQLHVEPPNAEYYRSQVTHAELHLAAYDPANLPGMSLAPKLNANGMQEQAVVDGQTLPVFILSRVSGTTVTFMADVVEKADGPPGSPARLYALTGHPLINYAAVYPAGTPQAGMPILNMLRQNANGCDEIYTDLTAVITGPNAGSFSFSENNPSFLNVPASPDRREPYREFTIIYHTSGQVIQAFDAMNDTSNPLFTTLSNGTDSFGINYGMAGIGAEIMANRLKVGPEADCVECKYEEFFLSSWSVGDPAMVVDNPANGPGEVVANPDEPGGVHVLTTRLRTLAPLTAALRAPEQDDVQNLIQKKEIAAVPQPLPAVSKAATKVFYPDDPSNVYHSYSGDHVKFRISNASQGQTHVHHQHAHQWLHTPNSDDGHYLDSQFIVPGAAYTLEMDYNGGGNRNQTVGDSIFHCHFYPHFADGMWSLWRVHDVFEAGSLLDSSGRVAAGSSVWNRALPDGEITTGTPIPAIVPLPTIGMAPIPSRVQITQDGKRAITLSDATPSADCKTTPNGCFRNPGFPFFIPGVGGHRSPHPPLDFAWKEDASGKPTVDAKGQKQYLDGGLPRHLILAGDIVREFHNKFDFSKDNYFKTASGQQFGSLTALQLPEDGTEIEKIAMWTHSTRTHATVLPNGMAANFTLNGLPPVSGAPFAPPNVSDSGNPLGTVRRYQAAAIQTDVVFNKKGWHYPQERLLALWEDVHPVVSGDAPPQPFFFRANSGESVEFWHTNLIPSYYEVDNFQVRTPTDLVGQHIHLVKFDVLASDGAANGFNYEDGTFSPDEVRDRIGGIDMPNAQTGGLLAWKPELNQCENSAGDLLACVTAHNAQRQQLTATPPPPVFGTAPQDQNWTGAQTTIQRWYADPQLNNNGDDRTLRTVFTHDHFGPSTHQQVGLYAGLLIEPEGSKWFQPDGTPMSVRTDGGPTNWAANIVTPNPAESFREFALEYQDTQLAYGPASPSALATTTQSMFTTKADYSKSLATCAIPQALKDEFKNNGVTLSSQAIVNNMASGTCTAPWTITDTGAPDIGGIYTLAAAVSSTQAVTLPVHGWMDSTDAIQSQGNTPSLITFAPNGTYVVNYRNEPLPLRVNPTPANPDPNASANAGDLAFAFTSIERKDPQLNCQPTKGNAISTPCGSAPGTGFVFPTPLSANMTSFDPYTPLLQAYQNDKVQVRTLAGAHFNEHSLETLGVNWQFEPASPNSGFKSSQASGLSEHFEQLFTLPHTGAGAAGKTFSDYLYSTTNSTQGFMNGNWGLLRAYDLASSNPATLHLAPLPNNPPPPASAPKPAVTSVCPANATPRAYNITAMNGSITYNTRGQIATKDGAAIANSQYINSSGLVYSTNGQAPTDALIIRANAGDCVTVTFNNQFTPANPVFTTPITTNGGSFSIANKAGKPFTGSSTSPAPVINLLPSTNTGITPQLVSVSATNLGANIGQNATQTVMPGGAPATYTWYMGKIASDGTGVPIEFGTVNLLPADPILQHSMGLMGALIVEPLGSTFSSATGHSAVVTKGKTSYQEFVAVLSTDALLTTKSNTSYTYNGAVNFGSEPVGYRQPSSGTITIPTTTDPTCWPAMPGTAGAPVCASTQAAFKTAGFTLSTRALLFGLGQWTVKTPSSGPSYTISIAPNGKTSSLVVTNAGTAVVFATPTRPQYLVGLDAAVPYISKELALVFAKNKQAMPAACVGPPPTGQTACVSAPQWQIVDGNSTPGTTTPVAGTYGLWIYQIVPASGNTYSATVATSNVGGTLSNAAVQNQAPQDPQTPIFTVAAGTPVRMRVAYPQGPNTALTFALRGHVWQEEPYRAGSRELGYNPQSEWKGSEQISPGESFDMLISEAGGTFKVPGDYLYNIFLQENKGIWGIMRVTPAPAGSTSGGGQH